MPERVSSTSSAASSSWPVAWPTRSNCEYVSSRSAAAGSTSVGTRAFFSPETRSPVSSEAITRSGSYSRIASTLGW